MGRISQELKKLSDFCERLGVLLSAACAFGIFGSIITSVAVRTVTGRSFLWTEEAARFFMIAGAFLGGSVALKRRDLVSFTVLKGRLGPRAGRRLEIIINLSCLCFLVCFLYCGIRVLPIYNRFYAVGLPVTLAWPACGLIVGAVFMTVHFLYFLSAEITGRKGEEGST